MDLGPPDSKRPRLWFAPPQSPPSLPHPHPHTHPHSLPHSHPHPHSLPLAHSHAHSHSLSHPPHSFPHAQAPQLPPPNHQPPSGPPLPHPPHHPPQHQLPVPSSSFSPYASSRPSEPPAAYQPPTTQALPVHGHAPLHQDVDRRHHEQDLLAPMQDPFRQPSQQQSPPPPSQASPSSHQQHQQQHQQHPPPLPPPPPSQQQQQQQHQQQQHQQQQQPPPPPTQQPQQQQQPPPLSPAHSHSFFHSYPPRDSAVIKRESEDIRRPSSTGHAPEPLGPTSQIMSSHPHPHPQPPPPFPDSQPRHMNYENAPSVPPTPGGYRTPTYGPPTPIPHQAQYEPPAPYPTQQEPYYGVYNANASKKKNTRASQACDQCRQLKAKCDELKPCKTCRDKGTECRYRDPVPKAISTDKAQADILEGIQSIQSILGSLSHQFERMDERVSKLEAESRRNASASSVKRDSSFEDDYKHASPPAIARHDPRDEDGIQDRPVISTEAIPVPVMVDDEIETEPGPPVAPGEPAIPINHTTLAGLLLDWDPIKVLTRTHLEQAGVRYISEYPIGIEQVRGLLKVYGRGEDSKTARQLKDGGDHGSVDMADDVSDIASSSPAADWGQLGSLSPGDHVVYQGGILGFDGNPDFTESKVWSYVESFKTHILDLHPIIQPHVLDEWVRHFLDSLPLVTQKSTKPMSSKMPFAVAPPYTEPAIGKRKRSPAPDGNGATTNSTVSMRAGRPSRSIHSALVLLIVALGKICLHRENVPDVVYHPDPPAAALNGSQESPAMRNGVPPSPIQGSPPGLAQSQPQHQHHSSGLPSPKEHERGSQSRRSSIHGSGSVRIGYSLKKNYEVIPGLEYFALATDILGNHHGAYHNIKNVYANIFAGLYHGQLARPLESFSFIHKAGHTLQVIMRPSLDRLHKIKQNSELPADTKSNDITLAFWTCLQLESDLIAELPLPPSGLLQYEDDMPNPNMRLLQGFEQRVKDSYLGQLYLRKHLNTIHRLFYSPDDKNRVESEEFKNKFKNVDLVSVGVSTMRWVPQTFEFSESDGPANDILAARLRAKYWGAQVITYRPFVRQILQWSFEKEFHPGRPSIIWSGFRDGIAPHIPASTTATSDLPPSIIELASNGIKALIESTRAFHGLGKDRPIITNVFGTAHAQWGNMLVLTAAFKDPILNQFVDKALLRGLFEKTLYFFRQSATMTSSLKIDMLILDGLYKDLFFGGAETGVNAGFSGNGGAQTPSQSMAAPPPLPYMANDVVMAQPSYSMPPAGHPQGH